MNKALSFLYAFIFPLGYLQHTVHFTEALFFFFKLESIAFSKYFLFFPYPFYFYDISLLNLYFFTSVL